MARPMLALLLITLLALGPGCSRPPRPPQEPAAAADPPARNASPSETTPSAASPTPETPGAEAALPVILCLGDSLTAGWGVDLEESYPSLLQAELAQRGYAYRVVNAGISGDTTAGGLSRLPALLAQEPAIVLVVLGANDGLRGLSPDQTRDNLRQVIRQSQAAGARVLLAGMRLPPNYGAAYTEAFAAIFADLAAELQVARIPFLLEGVAVDPSLNLGDGIHPNAAGYRVVTQTVLQALLPLLPLP